MLILSSSSDSLKCATTTTGAIDVHCSYITLVNATGVVTPGNQNTSIASIAVTTIVSPPASGSSISIKHVSIYNASGASQSIGVNLVNASGSEDLLLITLQAGYTLMYEDKLGWVVLDSSGGRIETPLAGRFLKTTPILNGTTSFTTGPSTNTVKLRACASGGAGGGAPATTGEHGSGGGAGSYCELVVAVTPNTAYTCSVGAGGTGVSAANGNNGANTTMTIGGVSIICNAGSGGKVGTSATVPVLGGAGGAASTGGTLNVGGESGETCLPSATVGHSGRGGSGPLGAGGAALLFASAAGANAVGFGAGGGGAVTVGSAEAGGAGANGIIIIDEYS